MGSISSISVRFTTCHSLKTQQQWAILKSRDDSKYFHICQRKESGGVLTNEHVCLTAPTETIPSKMYASNVRSIEPIREPNKEARQVGLLPQNLEDASQQWRQFNKTNQLAIGIFNVKYPKLCLTTRHFYDIDMVLLIQCHKKNSPNPQLPKNQHFYIKPALDQNAKQLCSGLI